jgi:hypothetical protein
VSLATRLTALAQAVGADIKTLRTTGLYPSKLASAAVGDVGYLSNVRAGRQLALTDFTTLCGLPNTPVGLFNLHSTANLGTGGALSVRGAFASTNGIGGSGAGGAALFQGNVLATPMGLYIPDTGAGDPFRLRHGSFGCWLKTAKRGTTQVLMAKASAASFGWFFAINSGNGVSPAISLDGSTQVGPVGTTDVCDDRWHFAVATYDGNMLALYIDGAKEAQFLTSGTIFSSTGPFDIGSQFADAATAANLPHFGLIDEAFVTHDVLTDEQIRLLYCAKIPHGFTSVPRDISLQIHRRRRGALYVPGDFPAAPARLYNGASTADSSANNVPLTANVGTGTIGQGTGPDGAKDSARVYSGAHTGDSATEAGLPSGAAGIRVYGCWFKTTMTVVGVIMGWGTLGTADARMWVSPVNLVAASGADQMVTASLVVNDGLWHFAIVIEDPNALDGVKRKLYLDGRLVAASTVLNTLTLNAAPANMFRLGASNNGANPFVGSIARAFVIDATGVTVNQDKIAALMNKVSQDLGASPRNIGEHIEGYDAANIYALFDGVDGQNSVELSVAA